jgi:hypothetical protein
VRNGEVTNTFYFFWLTRLAVGPTIYRILTITSPMWSVSSCTYVIMFVSGLGEIGVSLRVAKFPPTIKLDRINTLLQVMLNSHSAQPSVHYGFRLLSWSTGRYQCMGYQKMILPFVDLLFYFIFVFSLFLFLNCSFALKLLFFMFWRYFQAHINITHVSFYPKHNKNNKKNSIILFVHEMNICI